MRCLEDVDEVCEVENNREEGVESGSEPEDDEEIVSWHESISLKAYKSHN